MNGAVVYTMALECLVITTPPDHQGDCQREDLLWVQILRQTTSLLLNLTTFSSSHYPMAFLPANATNDDIVRHCSRANPTRIVISEIQGGGSVIRIFHDTVVKRGFGITEDDPINQMRANELIDQAVMRVPRVFRYFSNNDFGYILMEYIEGRTLDSVEDKAPYLQQMLLILEYMAQLQSEVPGPLSRGVAQGFLWIEGDPISPKSIQDIELYYNTRQLK